MTEPPLVAGETLIDFVPATADPLAEVESFDRRAGGAPANVAVGLSRLGRAPLFWTRLSTDPFGTFLADRLASEGIPERFVERDPDAATTLAFVSGAASETEDEADPRFTFYRDGTADTRLHDGTVPDETLDSTPWVHAGGVALADEPARSATVDLLDRAADAGCTVSFDPNVRPELWGNDAELATVCGWAIEATDVLIATPEELVTLGLAGSDLDVDPADDPDVGRDPEALARAALADAGDPDGPHTAVLTLGDAGALAVANEDAPWGPATARHEGCQIDAIDDTGAGDAFTAGLIDALDGGESIEDRESTETGELPEARTPLADALAFANAVAAMSTTERGAMEALPTREDVEPFLES